MASFSYGDADIVSCYIRTGFGDTFNVDSFESALKQLSGPDGYRLTITDREGNELTIRSNGLKPTDSNLTKLDGYLGTQSFNCDVTINIKGGADQDDQFQPNA